MQRSAITSWSSLAGAALAPTNDGVTGEKLLDGIGGLSSLQVNMITPWLGAAETYIKTGELTTADWVSAAGATVAAAVGGNRDTLGQSNLQVAANNLGKDLLIAGAMSAFDKDVAQSFMENAIGQEIGSLIGGQLVKSTGLKGWAESAYFGTKKDKQQAVDEQEIVAPVASRGDDELEEIQVAATKRYVEELSEIQVTAQKRSANITAQRGDSISTILGTPDPVAIEAFMRANNLTNSTIYAGREYVMPGSEDFAASTGQLGQATLNTDNARLAELAEQAAVPGTFSGDLQRKNASSPDLMPSAVLGGNSVADQIGNDFLLNTAKNVPVSALEYLGFVSKTTEQTRVRQFVGTVVKEGQFLVDTAGKATPSIRTTIQGEAVELIGDAKSAYGTVTRKALNVSSSADEVLRAGVSRITDAGTAVVEAVETTIRSATTPVLETAGALGKTARFLAGKAGGALLGAVDTVVANADYSNREGINASVAASVDTVAGAAIGATSVAVGNVAGAGAVAAAEYLSGGLATPAVPVIHVGTSLVVGSGIQASASYVYKNFVRAPAISLTTGAVTAAYSAGNDLLRYSKEP